MDIKKNLDFVRIDQHEKTEAYRVLNFLKEHENHWYRAAAIADQLEMVGHKKRNIQRYIRYLKEVDPKHNFVTSDLGGHGYIYTRDPEIFKSSSRKLTKFYKHIRDRADIEDYQSQYLKKHGFMTFIKRMTTK